MSDTAAQSVSGPALATLKHLALDGALGGETKISCSGLAAALDTSSQTASRRLQHLEDAGHLDREIVSDGQWVSVTDAGENRLRAEYDAYRRLFESAPDFELTGAVTSGMGEGRHYISLSGYMRQFTERLGYEPFPGTLNIDLDEESIRTRTRLSSVDPIEIEGWEDEERTYGPAYCYPATVVADEAFDPAHVIAPERTHHGDDHLEVIAPDRLRDVLDLDDGDEVTVRVAE